MVTTESGFVAQCNELGITVFSYPTAQDAADHALRLRDEMGRRTHRDRVCITYHPHNLAYPWEVHVENAALNTPQGWPRLGIDWRVA